MDLINSVAEGVGEAVANKLLNRKKREDNIFTHLFVHIKSLLDNPENMELRVTVENGHVVAKVFPDKEQKKGFVVKINTFSEES